MKRLFLIAMLLSNIFYYGLLGSEQDEVGILELDNQIRNRKKMNDLFFTYKKFKKYSNNSQSSGKKNLEQKIIQFFLTEESYIESQQSLDDFFSANAHIKKLSYDIIILQKRLENNYYTVSPDSFISK
jgi:hypothetical protein